ncbi:hypothetical protein CAEBREN_14671 [Caenorhabditis brenneri]|uniref:Helicase C-terminal domain-containing protein n=1 Tax=Caenorhabditis brenneri TaxID=135651 RepID=G0PFF1_CAEBE|nr:hypothetical protein CAEBREN_14671 [Caenorhabditis brenneri]
MDVLEKVKTAIVKYEVQNRVNCYVYKDLERNQIFYFQLHMDRDSYEIALKGRRPRLHRREMERADQRLESNICLTFSAITEPADKIVDSIQDSLRDKMEDLLLSEIMRGYSQNQEQPLMLNEIRFLQPLYRGPVVRKFFSIPFIFEEYLSSLLFYIGQHLEELSSISPGKVKESGFFYNGAVFNRTPVDSTAIGRRKSFRTRWEPIKVELKEFKETTDENGIDVGIEAKEGILRQFSLEEKERVAQQKEKALQMELEKENLPQPRHPGAVFRAYKPIAGEMPSNYLLSSFFIYHILPARGVVDTGIALIEFRITKPDGRLIAKFDQPSMNEQSHNLLVPNVPDDKALVYRDIIKSHTSSAPNPEKEKNICGYVDMIVHTRGVVVEDVFEKMMYEMIEMSMFDVITEFGYLNTTIVEEGVLTGHVAYTNRNSEVFLPSQDSTENPPVKHLTKQGSASSVTASVDTRHTHAAPSHSGEIRRSLVQPMSVPPQHAPRPASVAHPASIPANIHVIGSPPSNQMDQMGGQSQYPMHLLAQKILSRSGSQQGQHNSGMGRAQKRERTTHSYNLRSSRASTSEVGSNSQAVGGADDGGSDSDDDNGRNRKKVKVGDNVDNSDDDDASDEEEVDDEENEDDDMEAEQNEANIKSFGDSDDDNDMEDGEEGDDEMEDEEDDDDEEEEEARCQRVEEEEDDEDDDEDEDEDQEPPFHYDDEDDDYYYINLVSPNTSSSSSSSSSTDSSRSSSSASSSGSSTSSEESDRELPEEEPEEDDPAEEEEDPAEEDDDQENDNMNGPRPRNHVGRREVFGENNENQRKNVSESESSFVASSDEDDGYKKKKKKSKMETKPKKTRRGRDDEDEDTAMNILQDGIRQSRRLAGEDADLEREATPEEYNGWFAKDKLVTDDDRDDFTLSNKLVLLMEIINKCEEIGDKLLVFSQSLESLALIKRMLEYMAGTGQWFADGHEALNAEGETWSWLEGEDYMTIDGSVQSVKRDAVQTTFNDPENMMARLMLISTRAGSLGTNMVAANRVIIFDACWNPSHDTQSLLRVYRFGQTKPVYIYRFIAQGTMEERIYKRQVTKESTSMRVVDEAQIQRHYLGNDLTELYQFTQSIYDPDVEIACAPPKDRLLADVIHQNQAAVVDYIERDTLFANQEEEKLSEQEMKDAWADYEKDKSGVPMDRVPYHLGVRPQGIIVEQQMQAILQNRALETQRLDQIQNDVLFKELNKMRHKDIPTFLKIILLRNLLEQVLPFIPDEMRGGMTEFNTHFIRLVHESDRKQETAAELLRKSLESFKTVIRMIRTIPTCKAPLDRIAMQHPYLFQDN